MRPTNVKVIDPDAAVLARLSERSVLGDTLPSSRIAITPSQANTDVLWVVRTPWSSW
jgi:hypothetical protein